MPSLAEYPIGIIAFRDGTYKVESYSTAVLQQQYLFGSLISHVDLMGPLAEIEQGTEQLEVQHKSGKRSAVLWRLNSSTSPEQTFQGLSISGYTSWLCFGRY